MGCLWQIYKALSVLFFTLFLLLILLGVILLAGTGVVEVPGLSALFGQSVAPTPTPTIVRESAQGGARESGTPIPGSTATPEVVSEQTAAIQRAEDAIKQADEPGRFTIEVADSDLTALLGEVIASLDNPPVSNLVVTFEQDAFAASGTIIAPFRANIQAKGHFVVSEETVRIAFTEAKLGALTMPEALRDQLTAQANEYLDANVGETQGLRIDSVEIIPGKIIVTGERLER
ncbi:MAG: hypothetical protein OXK81_01320 [Chloroflexota bacterium]|nr:hypothetical protein [Chloroflexota bacterium]MDE2931049.1 hypothetical protein [Chloroflexota bacterium]